MKRLLQIGLSTFIQSIVPVITWFLLGIIVNPDLINVFTIAYPVQFIACFIFSIFSTGANVAEYKDNKSGKVLSGMTMQVGVFALIVVLLVFFVDDYLVFLSVDPSIYRIFTIYEFVAIFKRQSFSTVLEKLYFEGKEKLATILSVSFNLINLVVLVVTSLITKNQVIIISISLAVMFVYTFVIYIMQYKKFKFSFNVLSNIKYESENIVYNLLLFVTYFIGISNSFVYGTQYIIALNFVALISDSQWDACEAMSTVAKIDVVNKEYNFKKLTKICYAYVAILISSSVVMFFALYNLYNVDLLLGIYYLLFEIASLVLSPIYYYFEPISQIEWSATKNTIIIICDNIVRTVLSVALPMAFCTQIGMVASCVFSLVVYLIVKKCKFKTNKEGYLELKTQHLQ